MGTNYYLLVNDERIHIGKSSAGWKFMFEAHPEYGIFSVNEYLILSKLHKIEDEYGAIIEASVFWNMIYAKSKSKNQGPVYHNEFIGLWWEDVTGLAEFYNYQFS